MKANVAFTAVADLNAGERDAVDVLSRAVYPPAEWADWPGRKLEWEKPPRCVRVWGGDGELASYIGVVLRQATHDGRAVPIGGIGGVKTHPAARGRGYAALGVQRAIEFFQEQADVMFALLVCEPDLIPYYARLGWREFGGTLLVRQYGAIVEFTFDRTMTLRVRRDGPIDGVIDLCGPPW
ncbi:MAG: GNAT family N-acetyltransferase [Phycisphaerales bacterium]|nr:GNAT family N-acetyltransferase [Phycisphaerales bacterium]